MFEYYEIPALLRTGVTQNLQFWSTCTRYTYRLFNVLCWLMNIYEGAECILHKNTKHCITYLALTRLFMVNDKHASPVQTSELDSVQKPLTSCFLAAKHIHSRFICYFLYPPPPPFYASESFPFYQLDESNSKLRVVRS